MVTFVSIISSLMSTFYSLTIKEIRRETKKAVSIVFDIPENLTSVFNFIAGQYITIKKEFHGEEIRRSYSICSSTKCDSLRIAVKEVPNGTFSVYANSELTIGEILEVAPPEGRFILEANPNNNKNYLAVAAGSGITPIMGMIKEVLFNEPASTFRLIFGNKSVEDSIFKTEIETLLNQYPKQFSIQSLYSRTAVDNALFGRIDQGNLRHILNNKFSNITFDTAYLCGPEDMINTAKSTLMDYGLNAASILYELFHTADSEMKEKHEGVCFITVLVDDEETTFEMDTNNTILTASLENGIDAPYSCQGGICSSCLAKVTSGNAVMDKNTILSDEEVEEGFVLTCQAHPTTQNISIDYDDV